MKTIDSEVDTINEILSRRKGKEAVETLDYMLELSNYYHKNIDRQAELNEDGRAIKINWVYRKILIYLDKGERI